MATTAQITDIAPAREVIRKRVSASSTRTFELTSGEVEITPGTNVPSCSAKTSIATTASGTRSYFWALRASISIFHKESNTFITVEGAVHDLPDVSESLKGMVHEDSFWNTTDPRTQTSPGTRFRRHTAGLLKYAETAALVAETKGQSPEEIKTNAHRYLNAYLDTLQTDLQRSLQGQNTGGIELVRTDDGC